MARSGRLQESHWSGIERLAPAPERGGDRPRAGKAVLIAVVLVRLLLLEDIAQGAPLPPARVVNHETRECGEIFAGDECMDCFPGEGWEALGNAFDVECPAGYTEVDDVPYTCEAFKVQFCCSEGHSGAPGDCADLVVNDRTDQCAFVQDIEDCALPRRWDKKPDKLEPQRWECPAEYEWVDEVACLSESEQAGGSLSLPCLGALLSGPAAVVIWLLLRPRR